MIRRHARRFAHTAFAASLLMALGQAAAQNYPVTPQQRGTAQQVAQSGVPLSDLAPNAPDSHTVKAGDTLWGISGLFLKSPWRWPELWGMNLDQIRNPHLIYPGQIVYLDTSDGRARLRLGQAVDGGVVKLSPQVRSSVLATSAITSIPFNLIEPFLNEAVILDANTLEEAPHRRHPRGPGADGARRHRLCAWRSGQRHGISHLPPGQSAARPDDQRSPRL